MSVVEFEPFPELVRQYRLALGLTQEALAEQAGVSTRGVRALESGERQTPQRETVRLLADALGLAGEDRLRFEAAARLGSIVGPDAGVVQRLPAGGFLGSLPTTRLVGREAERERIEALIGAVAASEGRFLLLTGEPGAGKTRLGQEATALLQARGFLLAAGTCHEPQRTIAYAPLVEALGMLAAVAPETTSRDTARRWPYLTRLLPELGAAMPVVADRDTDAQPLLFRAVVAFLQAVAATRPVALLLDDLHWADGASLMLLAFLARQTRSDRVLLLGTYRNTDLGRNHPLRHALVDLRRMQLAEEIAVQGLPHDGTATLIAQTLGRPAVAARLADTVYARTGGNPFFVQELVRALADQGQLDPSEGGIPTTIVPTTVQAVLAHRIEGLADTTQQILRAASVLGQQFRFEDLGALSRHDADAVEGALDEAQRAGLVREMDIDLYAFNHALTEHAVRAELSSTRRRWLHGAAGRLLEALPDRERERRAAELAWHFREAGEPERALAYTLQAGDQAAAVFAYAEAERQGRRALRLAHDLHAPMREAEALEQLGRVFLMSGRLDEAAEVLEHAITLYHDRRQLDAEAQAIAASALVNFWRGRVDLSIERVRHVRAAIEAQGPSVTLGRLYVAEFLYLWSNGRMVESGAPARRALAIARLVGDDVLLVETLVRTGAAEREAGNVHQALELLEEASRRAEACGTLYWQVHAEVILGESRSSVGQLTGAHEAFQRAHDLALRLQNPDRIAYALSNHGETLRLRGDWEGAERDLEGAMAWVPLAGDSWGGFFAPLRLGRLYTLLGRWDEAEQQLRQAWALSERGQDRQWTSYALTALAELARYRGNLEEALSWLERAPEITAGSWIRGVVLLEGGRVSEAESIARAGLESERRVITDLPGWHLLLGAVLSAQHRWQDAQEQIDAGLAVARDVGMPCEEGMLVYLWGSMDAARDDRDAARSRLRDALAIFQQLGARPYRQWTEQTLAQLGNG
jgi:tetratricopeptide (TPR) repeat protein/transcriptional regulator with XRE-family HTH domain